MRRQPPRAAGCGLERVFEGLAVGENAPRETAQDLSFYEQGGFGCTIHGESVPVGDGLLPAEAGCASAQQHNLKTGIFLAHRSQLAAVFAVKYEASENVDYALRTLRRSRITPILAVRDPNITPALLKRKFYKKIKVEYPQLTDRVALSEAEEDRGLPRALAAAEACCPTPKQWWAAARLRTAVRRATWLSLAGSAAGVLLTAYLVSLGKFDLLHPLVPDGVFAAVDPAGAADERLDRPILTLDRIKYREAAFSLPPGTFSRCPDQKTFFQEKWVLRSP